MKRPFFTTPKGQRLAMHLGNLLSVLLLVALSLYALLIQAPRASFPAIDSANLQSCELESCPPIESLGGLEVANVTLIQGETINTIAVEFVNRGRLVGERGLRLELRNKNGEFLEAASSVLLLREKGRNTAEFGITTDLVGIEAGDLILRY